jgi:hypothetical protein
MNDQASARGAQECVSHGASAASLLAADVARTLRGAAFPIGCYYAIALVVPLLNGGAAAGSAFVEHELFVVLVPPLLVVLLGLARGIVRIALERWAHRGCSGRAPAPR